MDKCLLSVCTSFQREGELVFVESLPEVIETYGRFLSLSCGDDTGDAKDACPFLSFFPSFPFLFLCNFRQVFQTFLSCF